MNELFENLEEEMLANYFHSDGEEDITSQYEERIENIVSKCEEELARLRLLLWAAAKTNGGRLVIKNKYITQGGTNLARENDNKNNLIILTAQEGE